MSSVLVWIFLWLIFVEVMPGKIEIPSRKCLLQVWLILCRWSVCLKKKKSFPFVRSYNSMAETVCTSHRTSGVEFELFLLSPKQKVF